MYHANGDPNLVINSILFYILQFVNCMIEWYNIFFSKSLERGGRVKQPLKNLDPQQCGVRVVEFHAFIFILK